MHSIESKRHELYTYFININFDTSHMIVILGDEHIDIRSLLVVRRKRRLRDIGDRGHSAIIK